MTGIQCTGNRFPRKLFRVHYFETASILIRQIEIGFKAAMPETDYRTFMLI
jgi:hypothetical protein